MRITPVRLVALAASCLVILLPAYAAETKGAAAAPNAAVMSFDPAKVSPQDLEKLPANQVLESHGQRMTAGELRARRLKLAQTRDARIAQVNKAGFARFDQVRQQFLSSQLSKLETESQQAFQAFRSSHPGGVTKN